MFDKVAFISMFCVALPFAIWEYAFNQDATLSDIYRALLIWLLISIAWAFFNCFRPLFKCSVSI